MIYGKKNACYVAVSWLTAPRRFSGPWTLLSENQSTCKCGKLRERMYTGGSLCVLVGNIFSFIAQHTHTHKKNRAYLQISRDTFDHREFKNNHVFVRFECFSATYLTNKRRCCGYDWFLKYKTPVTFGCENLGRPVARKRKRSNFSLNKFGDFEGERDDIPTRRARKTSRRRESSLLVCG